MEAARRGWPGASLATPPDPLDRDRALAGPEWWERLAARRAAWWRRRPAATWPPPPRRAAVDLPDPPGDRGIQVGLHDSGRMISLEYGSPEATAQFVTWVLDRFPPPDDVTVQLFEWGDHPRVTARAWPGSGSRCRHIIVFSPSDTGEATMRMRTWLRQGLPVMALLASAVVAFPDPALAAGHRVIRVTTTIQAAVDAAKPGDTVVVPPGTYRESVLVDKSSLTLRGSRGAIIDANGFSNGIRVGSGAETPGPAGFPVCPPLALRNVTVEGLTVRNAEDNGIFLIGVDGFRVRGGRYLDNHEYGVFPRCSTHGLIEGNLAEGANDTGIYVGNDTEVLVTGNRAIGNTSGFEVENSSDVVVRGNHSSGNTAGILVFVLPGLPRTTTDHVLVEGNVVTRNNRPNPVPPDSGEDLGLVPTGSGILDIAADDVTFRRNVVVGNGSVGVAVVASPFAGLDPRVEPNPDRTRVVGNVLLQNGLHPDPVRAGDRAADIVYDGSGTANCFAGNVFRTDFPSGITARFPCT